MEGGLHRVGPAPAETLASCIKLTVPSIMRAPPEQETTMIGFFWASERSTARVTFSPTTAPIDPPMKPNSIEQQMTGLPSRRSFGGEDGVLHAEFFLCVPQARRVLPGVGKMQGIARGKV